MEELPKITSHRIQNNVTEYLVKWEDGETTWETKEDLENSEFKELLTKYMEMFSKSSIPMKILGKSKVDNTIYVRWKDGSYQYTNKSELLFHFPELFI